MALALDYSKILSYVTVYLGSEEKYLNENDFLFVVLLKQCTISRILFIEISSLIIYLWMNSIILKSLTFLSLSLWRKEMKHLRMQAQNRLCLLKLGSVINDFA